MLCDKSCNSLNVVFQFRENVCGVEGLSRRNYNPVDCESAALGVDEVCRSLALLRTLSALSPLYNTMPPAY